MKKQILVVDDEQGYQDLYTFLLQPLGVQISYANNGLEAVEKIQKDPYDLIFMDIHMPVMSGPEAFKRIRQIRPDQKVVIFTSSSDPSFSQENKTLEEGALVCLYKPVSLEDLQRVVHENLGVKLIENEGDGR